MIAKYFGECKQYGFEISVEPDELEFEPHNSEAAIKLMVNVFRFWLVVFSLAVTSWYVNIIIMNVALSVYFGEEGY